LFAIVDIETTGGNAFTDKITEIAIYIHNGEKVIDEYNTLINPGRSIPPFVQNLTGITDEMVAYAPAFSDVAEDIKRFTDSYIFVAHSSQFDYSFIRQEFKSTGYDFQRPSICTVSFSRKVLPGHKSYGLSALCQRLSIQNTNRHRATGDAFATVKLFESLMMQGGRAIIESVIKPHENEIELPECIKPEIMGKLPARAGVFFLLDRNEEVIYVGKARSIRKEVLLLVTKTRNKKLFRLREDLHNIRFEETGTELLAAILEFYEWKKLLPRYNRKFAKPYHRLNYFSKSGMLVLTGRTKEEECFISLSKGVVSGYAFLDHLSQGSPEDTLVKLFPDHYVDYLVQKAIIKKQFVRFIES
jgi:DNA polymerase-3 subunit epsilon